MRTAYDGEGSAGGLRDGPEEGPYPPPEERPSDAPEGPPEDRSSDPSLRHLLARAILVEERVRRAVAARQATDPQPDDAFRGLYLSDEAVHHLLDHGRSLTGPDHADAVRLAEAEVYADAADRDGGPTRLRHLARTFALTELDLEILLISLVPDLDDRFEQFYGYLNDHVGRCRPTIGLALGLCGLPAADPYARARLAPQAPLRAGGLLVVEETDRPFLSRSLRVPDRVAGHLLGDDTPAPRLADLLTPWHDVPGVGDPDVLARALSGGARLVHLREDQGGAGTALAARALLRSGRGVLGVDLQQLAHDPNPAEAVRVLAREARLTGSGVVCAPLDALTPEHTEVLRLLADMPPLAVLVGRTPWDAAWSAHPPLLLRAPRVDPETRAALWTRNYDAPVPAGLDLTRTLAPFLLTPDQITRAARSTAQAGLLDAGPLHPDHVRRRRARPERGRARTARPPYRTRRRLGRPGPAPDPLAQLHELAARARHRDRVLGEWRMRPGGGRGRGVTALFAGDSGTGKTMSAEVIAADLGLDLYTVNLATVIDKYVGETEKNLERIFSEAERRQRGAALRRGRRDLRQAQRGPRRARPVRQHRERLPAAADGDLRRAGRARHQPAREHRRRLHPAPRPHRRLPRARPRPCAGACGSAAWAARCRVADDLDLDFCAEAFELSGGNIRSIAVTAAYLAADSGTVVTMSTLIHAVQREYQKLGRLTLASEFGPYMPLLAG